jgi:hypothetical protein
MPTASEVVLASIPASEQERLLLVMVTAPEGTSHLELQQQSFSPGIGWYTQSRVQIAPHQVAALRNSLGNLGRGQAAPVAATFRRLAPTSWEPRVVHADSA